MWDLSSTVWDTLLLKASSPQADSLQKWTQTYAEKVRQEERGHTRGPPFVWAYLGLVNSLQQRDNTVGTRTAQSLRTFWVCQTKSAKRSDSAEAPQDVQSRRRENHAEHRVTEKRLLVLEALGQTEAERKYGRAPPTAMERKLQTFLEHLLKT